LRLIVSLKKKVFFFEKKNQKTFATWHAWPTPNWATYAKEEKFFASFFQKRSLAFFFGFGMTTLLVRNATVVVTMDATRREINGGGLFARDGIIEQVGPDAHLPSSADHIVYATNQILLPGLVNCHHHLDQILTRNLPAGQNAELFDWLRAHYSIWARRTPEASRTATLVGLAELALSGCTTCFDHSYLFQNGCRVDDQIGAAAEIGMRFMAARGSMSLGQSKGGLPPDNCVENESVIMADCERVISRYHNPDHGAMLRIVLAPCSPFSVTDQLLRDSATLARARGIRLHTHLCETIDEEDFTLSRHGVRPIDYMRRLEWVDDDVWFAHAVHVNDPEIALLARTGAGVCHCPTSNMRLASGIAPLRKFIDAGVRAGLGVDGAASNDGSNLLAEARQAMLLARLKLAVAADPARIWTSARDVLELATLGGAAVLGRNDIGALESGRCADFFTLDLDKIGYAGALCDAVAAVIFCAPTTARHTYVHGIPIVTDCHVTTIDMATVVQEHNRHAARLLS
jgi:cytosine/adenosine deaminase-related metal-dependent hydrolase